MHNFKCTCYRLTVLSHIQILIYLFSALWDVDKYCQEKQSQYQKLGIQGRWQVHPDELEPPHKKAKTEVIDLDNVIKMKVIN